MLFLDSDDFFSPDLIEKCYENAIANDSDIVLFGGKKFDSAAEKVIEKREFLRPELCPQKDIFCREDIPDTILRVSNPAPWSKFFSKRFINETGLRFQKLPNSNDFYFSMGALALAQRISVVDEDLVFYRINAKGNTQLGKYKNPLCFLDAIKELYNLLKNRGIYEQIKQSFLHVVLSTIKFNLESVQTDQARFDILNELMQEDIVRMDLFHKEQDYYCTKLAYNYAMQISSALVQYNELMKNEVHQITECVVQHRACGCVKVSVIIPVYNMSVYLEDTLKSVAGQSLEEIEIICINDGSTDDSLAILLSWAEKNSHISVYTQANAGLAATRNEGMKRAIGQYIYFMDADDKLESDALELLYKKASSENLDIVYFDGASFFDESLKNPKEQSVLANSYVRSCNYENKLYKGVEIFSKMQFNGDYFPSVCLQFFKSDFIRINQLKFHRGVIHEDNAFSFMAVLQAQRTAYMHKALFYRRIRQDSIMTNPVSFKNCYGYFTAFQDMYAKFTEIEDVMDMEVKSAAWTRICVTLRNAQRCYANMPIEQRGSELGLGSGYRLFKQLISVPVITNADLLQTKERIQKINNEKTELKEKLQKTYDEKYERGVEIRRLKSELKKEKSELNAKLQKTCREKAERDKEIKRLRGSWDYRIGHKLLWLLFVLI